MLSDVSGFFRISRILWNFLRFFRILSDLFSILPFSFPRTLSERDSLLDSLRFSPILANPPRFFPDSALFFRIFSRFFWSLSGFLSFSRNCSRFSQIVSGFCIFSYSSGFCRILCESFPIFFYFSRIPNASGFSWIFLISTRFFKSLFFSDYFRIVANCLELFSNALGFFRIPIDSLRFSWIPSNLLRFVLNSLVLFRIFLDSLRFSHIFSYSLGIVPDSLKFLRNLPAFLGFSWILWIVLYFFCIFSHSFEFFRIFTDSLRTLWIFSYSFKPFFIL